METMTKHTPGPWEPKIGKNGAMSEIIAPEQGDEYRIAYVLLDDNRHQRPVDIQNAVLLASAPTLLAALKDMVELYEALTEKPGNAPAHHKARLAIAEAESEIKFSSRKLEASRIANGDDCLHIRTEDRRDAD